jgi:fucose 4-O-acetylase-like acetyltransferase
VTVQAILNRITWIDSARGIGILLVVYAHAVRGVFPVADSMPTAWRIQDDIIYAFHMPLFFILAGLFLWPSLAKGRTSYMQNKAVMVAYPYFLWSLIMGGIQLLFAGHVNTPVSWRDLALIPVKPIEQFWFLYALFICQLIVMLCYSKKWMLYAVAPLCLVIYISGSSGDIFVQSLFWLPLVVLGVAVAPALFALAEAALALRVAVAAIAWILFAALIGLGSGSGDPGVLARLATGVTGGFGIIGVAMLMPQGAATRFVAQLGMASLAIYVMHTIFSAGARVALGHVQPALDPAAIIAMATITGIALPLAIFLFADRFGFGQIIGIGGRPWAAVDSLPVSRIITSE